MKWSSAGTPGQGPYEGQTWNGKEWVGEKTPTAQALWARSVLEPASQSPAETGPPVGAVWDGQRWIAPQMPQRQGRSAARVLGGILALMVSLFALLQGWSWLSGYFDLQAQGNQFAGLLVILGLGAWAVAAGFGIWGLVLLSKK